MDNTKYGWLKFTEAYGPIPARYEIIGPFNSELEAGEWWAQHMRHSDLILVPIYFPADVVTYQHRMD